MSLLVDDPADLGPAEIRAVADGDRVQLSAALLDRLAASRAATLAALDSGGPVYGVTTGMGLQSHVAVGATDAPAYQDELMLARSVGSAPWLDHRTARAVLASRLRTLLDPETGASPELAMALVALLDADVRPAVPAHANGAAGEIIPLAHLGALLSGSGDAVDRDGATVPAAEALARGGVAPYTFGAKEGVAFLQGVPVATARALLLMHESRVAAAQALTVGAAEIAVVRAPRDPYAGALVRGDRLLARVHAVLRDLAGDEAAPRMLQAPCRSA